MQAKTYYIEKIGEIDFVKNKRSKHIKITLKPCGKVRVSLPLSCCYKEAMDFVIQKADRIKNWLSFIKQWLSARILIGNIFKKFLNIAIKSHT